MAPKTGGYGGCGGGGAAIGQGKNEKQKTSAEQHQADTRELIRSLPVNAIVCFTDGSSKGNPGPAGAGAVVCFPSLPPDSGGEGGGGGSGGDGDEDQDLARLSGRMELLAIAQVGDARCGTWMEGVTALGRQTNNVAELEAVRLANSIAVEARAVAAYYARCPIHIITDSIYARGVVMGTMRAAKNQELVRAAGGEIADSQADVHWCKGHAGIPGNERADRLADLGADKSARSSKVERVVATVGARR
jgi:ribonuclease HI